jgi:hypothetical protein
MTLHGLAQLPADGYTNSALMTAATRFPALGDIFVFPRPLPLANVFSVGDLLIAVGAVVFLVRQMRVPTPGVPFAGAPARSAAGG